MTEQNEIDMWHGEKFAPKKYGADATFYPHGSFGYSYRGNIYDENGNAIGDYATNDSCWIEENFLDDRGKWNEELPD